MEVERVQAIASLSKLSNTIPSQFIRSENEQPAASTLHGAVPVIDLGGDEADKRSKQRVGDFPSGYGTSLQKEIEGKKGWVDHLFHKIWPSSAVNYNFWPKNPSYREANEEYAEKLLEINYYPPCPRPDLGVVAHTDMSAITILVPNEVQGLQVFRDGHWYEVKYIPNALIIHIGDQIEGF
ncbi:hypothetical protein SASPL_148115 [Salvia splendens]|uniref:Fe2OG dioxygenase domain-containing protein n=1 Tax=Salvia splendens TaxID=180675 RepID=A0A8X8W9D4_SALSN|nr:hypothetical protein SASPL_148115 [Salvia splendens]